MRRRLALAERSTLPPSLPALERWAFRFGGPDQKNRDAIFSRNTSLPRSTGKAVNRLWACRRRGRRLSVRAAGDLRQLRAQVNPRSLHVSSPALVSRRASAFEQRDTKPLGARDDPTEDHIPEARKSLVSTRLATKPRPFQVVWPAPPPPPNGSPRAAGTPGNIPRWLLGSTSRAQHVVSVASLRCSHGPDPGTELLPHNLARNLRPLYLTNAARRAHPPCTRRAD